MHDYTPMRRRRRRFDDEDDLRHDRLGARRDHGGNHDADQHAEHYTDDHEGRYDEAIDGLPAGDRWSTWDASAAGERGPRPYPDWLVTDLGAVDTDLGVLKTGKEADVHLLRREVPDTARSCLLASKRYRATEHRMFHRDAGYLEGRRVRRSREMRAMARRTGFGKELIATQWAGAEFGALCRLYQAGVPVPYPAQIVGTELLLEFVGEPDGTAAPRLAQVRPSGAEREHLWEQLVDALVTMARLGLAHGDLSPYNVLVHEGRLVLIDLPQIVDVVANPQGSAFLDRDATVMATWFATRGQSGAEDLTDLLHQEAGLR